MCPQRGPGVGGEQGEEKGRRTEIEKGSLLSQQLVRRIPRWGGWDAEEAEPLQARSMGGEGDEHDIDTSMREEGRERAGRRRGTEERGKRVKDNREEGESITRKCSERGEREDGNRGE